MLGTLLIADDEETIRENLAVLFRREGYRVHVAASGEEALESVEAHHPDVLLLDLKLPGMDGIGVLRELSADPHPPGVILLTAYGDIPTAVEAVKFGAADFLTKPVDLDRLRARVAEVREARRVAQPGRRAFPAGADLREALGRSEAMAPVIETLERLAGRDVTVLLTGESGTGKGLVARLLHERGARAGGPLVEVNCAGLTAPLLESELFGHERGAFTDARAEKRGLLEVADAGTLFLDEIGEMPLEVQPKVLTAIETRRFRRLGGVEERRADVRIVASTNRDLERAVREGRFRADLFHRLNVVALALPPLRARGADVLALARRFVAESAREFEARVEGIAPEAEARLGRYGWPGNVRELRNVLERAVVLARGPKIVPEDLTPAISGLAEGGEAGALPTMEEAERELIRRALAHTKGNRSRAARALGISRTTLLSMIRRFGLT
ncbi:MAG: sigma-54 dependent transcriptional regulator [Planctomycetales bacterium]|nr:sigma-54 dependent transcriptional regulator [Planctomycetales bacterium]